MNTPDTQKTVCKMKDGGNKRKLSIEGKRAAHVKWDGKTIALGTFPDEEAEIMCKRAKILTKKWRSMYPKPNVEWVKQALEGCGIRVVNNRPGRQSKKDGNSNQKGPVEEEISITKQIQARSLLSFVTIPPLATKIATMNPHIDSVTNIPERGSTTPPSSNRQTSPIDLQRGNDDPPVPAPRTKSIEADGLVKDQDEERLARPDLKDLDIEITYATLERHHSNLKTEVEEIEVLMNFYRDERSRRQLIREQYQERKRKELIDQQTSMQMDPITINKTPNHPIHTLQNCPDIQPQMNRPRGTLELCVPMHDGGENNSITKTIELEDWRC